MMNEQMQYYSSIWEQDYYQYQQPVGELGMSYNQGYSDSNEVSPDFYCKTLSIPEDKTLTNADVSRNMHCGSSPETANPVISPGKPKRRRSKGSPSQSTTFLNASIKDFRALVQQHTGCHSSINSSPKGPITLCFGSAPSTQEAYHLNHQHYT